MDKREINPTTWLGEFHINHGIEVTGGQRVLYLSGQTSTDDAGAPLHPGDLVAQFRQAWENVKAALAAADMTTGDVVRLNLYTTDVESFMASAEDIIPILANDGCKPVSTLLGVTRLFDPSMMIEIEATATA